MKFFLSFPMLSCFVLGVALVAMSYQYKRLASILIIAVIISQYLFATPLMTKLLFMVIGRYPPLSLAQLKQQNPQAIIIFGGGLYKGQEYNNVYQAEDIISNKMNPKIIAKYMKDGEKYSIPEFNI